MGGREPRDGIDREARGNSRDPADLRARDRGAEAVSPARRERQRVAETVELGVRRRDGERVELVAHDDLRRAVRRAAARPAPRVDRRGPLGNAPNADRVSRSAHDLGDPGRQALPHQSRTEDQRAIGVPHRGVQGHRSIDRSRRGERRRHAHRPRGLDDVHGHALRGGVERAADLRRAVGDGGDAPAGSDRRDRRVVTGPGRGVRVDDAVVRVEGRVLERRGIPEAGEAQRGRHGHEARAVLLNDDPGRSRHAPAICRNRHRRTGRRVRDSAARGVHRDGGASGAPRDPCLWHDRAARVADDGAELRCVVEAREGHAGRRHGHGGIREPDGQGIGDTGGVVARRRRDLNPGPALLLRLEQPLAVRLRAGGDDGGAVARPIEGDQRIRDRVAERIASGCMRGLSAGDPADRVQDRGEADRASVLPHGNRRRIGVVVVCGYDAGLAVPLSRDATRRVDGGDGRNGRSPGEQRCGHRAASGVPGVGGDARGLGEAPHPQAALGQLHAGDDLPHGERALSARGVELRHDRRAAAALDGSVTPGLPERRERVVGIGRLGDGRRRGQRIAQLVIGGGREAGRVVQAR